MFLQKVVVKKLQQYRLVLHPGVHPYPVSEGIPFLGFIIFPEKRRLKRRKGVFYQRRLKRLIKQYSMGQINDRKVMDSVRGWSNHARYGNTVGLRKAVLKVCEFIDLMNEKTT